MTAAVQQCAQCGGDLGSYRVMVGKNLVHERCSHAARDHRIADLEACIREMHACIPGGSTCDPRVIAAELRAIAAELRAIASVAGVMIDD